MSDNPKQSITGRTAALIGFIWCILLHRPAILCFGKAIPGSEQGDTLRGHWSAWAAAQDQWTIDTFLVNFPDGANLLALPPISLLIVSPFTLLFGASVGISALVFLHSLLSVYAGYFLGKTTGLRTESAIVCGVLLSATPMLGETLSLGIYECQTIAWSALCFGALIRALRGKIIWGVAAGFFYMITAVESGYYGSAAALGCLVLPFFFLRNVKGIAGGAVAAVTVGLMAWLTHKGLEPALGKFSGDVGGIQAGGMRVAMGPAELLAAIPGFSPPPPPPGEPEPFISAPSLVTWILFATSIVLSWRKSAWAILLSLLFLLTALNSPMMQWWIESPLGEFVKAVRRYSTPFGLMTALIIAHGLEETMKRWPKTDSLRFCLLVAVVGACFSAHRTLLNYPLLWTPKTPQFAKNIKKDPSPGAVIVVPQEKEDNGRNKSRSHNTLRMNTSFSNPQARLWFQTLIDRPMRHHSKLSTLIPSGNTRLGLDNGIVNADEIIRLKKSGLRYLILDHTLLGQQKIGQHRQKISGMGYKCREHQEWGGVDVCLLEGRLKSDR